MLVLALGLLPAALEADEFKQEDLTRWEAEFMSVVNYGRELWGSPDIGTNGVACGQCHPNAANTHPETYPKFQQQLGKVMSPITGSSQSLSISVLFASSRPQTFLANSTTAACIP